jgi:hypothetical protein
VAANIAAPGPDDVEDRGLLNRISNATLQLLPAVLVEEEARSTAANINAITSNRSAGE